jgi:hypothetical protein
MSIKTTKRYHFTTKRITIIKISDDKKSGSKSWQNMEKSKLMVIVGGNVK